MKTIWITGAGGLIGNYLVQSAPTEARVIGLTHTALDLTDFPAVRAQFKQQQPQLVIHCAALSQSPACQADPALARKVNVEATALLAQLAAAIPFFFLSTDLVFDGRLGHYDESAQVNPLSAYSETKAEAERVVFGQSAPYRAPPFAQWRHFARRQPRL